MTRSRAMWPVMAVVLLSALFVGSRRPSGPPTENQRVNRITSAVRCPTCKDLSAAQSDAPSSEAIREEVRRRVQDGETDGQVTAYLVGRYGESILLQPKARGVGLVVYALPVVGGAVAVGGLVVVLRRRRGGGGGSVSDADQALVQEALGR